MRGFLDYCSGESIFHRMNPLAKLIISLFLCSVCFVSTSHAYILALVVLNIIIAVVAGVSKQAIRLLKGLLKLSIVLFIVQVAFVDSGEILLTIPYLNLGITDNGVRFSSLIVLRLIAATLPLALMLSVTKINDLTNVFVAQLRIPYKYVFAFTTAVRFIPVFATDITGIMEAQTARGVCFDTKNPFKKLALIVPLCVPLLISSVKKIDAGALSAELRGFNLRTRNSGYKHYSFRLSDTIAILASLLFFLGALVI